MVHATLGQLVTAGMLDVGLNYDFMKRLCSEAYCKILIWERMGFSRYDVEPKIQLLYPAGVVDHELLP